MKVVQLQMSKTNDRPSAVTSRLAWCFASVVMVGCASSGHRAPVEEREPVRNTPAPAVPPPTAASPPAPLEAPVKPLPGAENAGKPGFYTVKPGDTLIRVALENGQNWKDLVRWNALENPNIIEVGQVLRVVPPGADVSPSGTRAVTTSRVETRPLDAKPPASAASAAASAPATAPTTAPAPVAASSAPVPVPPIAAASAPAASKGEGDDDINWAWPAGGPTVSAFDEARTKGIGIGGKAGDPVYAAADGRVVYAGSGLRGYGNLVILKHNGTYLSAYAHNQTLLVKEDQPVRKGQKIAEMGSSDADKVQLHFEIRRLGKPIDPAKLLPPR